MSEVQLDSFLKSVSQELEIPESFHEINIQNSAWQVPKRYQNLEIIGLGAYGMVCSAHDTVLNRKVAVKKLTRPFETSEYAKRTHRELTITGHMNHENIVCLIDVFCPTRDRSKFNQIYFVTPLMCTDLAKLLKCHPLDNNQICFFVYQIFRGLKYLHSAGLIHRDLKPSNIGVNQDCELKILDFGLARVQSSEMTGYVATRWYRAPEVILNWTKYNESVDYWSVGCIMAEMYTEKILFKGNDQIDQIKRIMNIIGAPDEEMMLKIKSDSAKNYIRSMKLEPLKDLKTYLKLENEPFAVDLLERILVLDPDRRISILDALAHPYFNAYHDINDEPTSEVFQNHSEEMNMSLEEWKDAVWKEIEAFKPKLDSIHASG